MKKSTKHNLDDLIKRLVKSIEKRNPQEKIEESGKLFLKAKWYGQEAKLHELVKKMENQEVQNKNLNDVLKIVKMEYCTGVDFLGFPTFTVHEHLVQHNLSSNKKISSTAIIDKIQYDFKAL